MTPLAELSSRHPEYRKAHKQLTTVARRNGEVAGGSRQRWKAKVLQRVQETRDELAGVQQHITELEHETREEFAGVKQRLAALEP